MIGPYDRRNYLELLRKQLVSERSSWEAHWRELADFIMPRRIRLNMSDQNRGTKKNNRIVNNTATIAARTLRSGMMAGVTSPARHWFKLAVEDKELNRRYDVQMWLYDVTERMYAFINSSNAYNSLPVVYGDLGVLGTAAMSVLESNNMGMTTNVLPIGSYYISTNGEGRVDTIVRDCRMTVRQVVERFVRRPDGQLDWSKASTTVKNLWDGGSQEEMVDVVHAVYPNENYNPLKIDGSFKRFASCYYEVGSSDPKFLNESGFDEFPVLAPRWDLTGDDVYGSSPGMDALGDVRALQIIEKRKAQAMEKIINPPMTAPASLRNQRASILPGDITYVDVRDGQDGFKPAHEIRFSVREVADDIAAHEFRIRRAFYEDLFLMLAMSDRREITAREVAERHEEKLLALGPVVGRLNSDLLDLFIDRTFEIMVRQNKIPPPPAVLEGGIPLRVEYISMMAVAQRMINLGSNERFATFATNLSTVVPQVIDKVDFDEVIEEHADMMGISPRILRSPDAVKQIRDQRAQQEQAAARAQQAEQMAKAARNLSETDVTTDNALTRMADRAATAI